MVKEVCFTRRSPGSIDSHSFAKYIAIAIGIKNPVVRDYKDGSVVYASYIPDGKPLFAVEYAHKDSGSEARLRIVDMKKSVSRNAVNRVKSLLNVLVPKANKKAWHYWKRNPWSSTIH